MVDFQEDNFEQKLLSLKDTQESIQALSIWCLKHQSHHKKVVGCWLHVLKKVKVEQRVTLFYLANDVIQYSKRKGYPFVESWATALQKATTFVRDDKVKHKILRLFKIWDERNVYDEAFLADLSGLLTAHTKKSNQPSAVDLISEFQPSLLFSKIRKCKVLEDDTDLKLKIVKESNLPMSDLDALQIAVKDRRNGDDLLQDIDDGLKKLEAYTKALELEIKERIEVINVLEVSEQFYETQRGEAKVVCNAYRNFGSRIKSLKRKLDELLPTLSSPVPSPDINAPSPSSGSDIEIPDENKTVYDSEKSFIGTDFVTAMNSANEKQYQYHRSNLDQSYNIESNQSQYSVHSLPSYDSYPPSRDVTMPMQDYYSSGSCHNMLENPATPEKHFNTDPFSYRPENVHSFEQGNPIEVINSNTVDNHEFSVGQFLQNLMTNNPVPTPVPPAESKIPGLESPTANSREVFSFIESKVKEDNVPLWNDKPLTKYQSWPSPDISWNPTQETPVSPPAFERESYTHPVEYVDTNLDSNRFPNPFGTDQRGIDIDHRMLSMKPPPIEQRFEGSQIATIPLPKQDIDDRLPLKNSFANHNLISLTESPSVNDNWKPDSDFRRIPMPPAPPCLGEVGRTIKTPQDNIESVDMEMSDDEEGKHEDKKNDSNSSNRHRKGSVKEEDRINNPPQRLQPPPNPWDLLNIPMGGDDNLKPPPNNFLPNSGPIMPPPGSDFSQFPMAANPRAMKPFPEMHFGPPPPMPLMGLPTADPTMFRPRMDFPRLPNLANGFNGPFNFIRNGPPMVFPSGGPGNMTRTPTKDFPPPQSFNNDNNFKNKSNDYPLNVNPRETRFHQRQFEEQQDFPPKIPTKSVRSNLKEISLSDVLERTMNSVSESRDEAEDSTTQNKKKNADEEETEQNDNLDLFAEDITSTANDATHDDGDDLYNNIIEETDESFNAANTNKPPSQEQKFNSASKEILSKETNYVQNNDLGEIEPQENSQNDFSHNDNTPKVKAPFQATVPKLPKPIMAPPNLMEDCNNEERNPWPMMPVIDLSHENPTTPEFDPNNTEFDPNDNRFNPLAFLKPNGSTDFRPRFNRGAGNMNNDFRPQNNMFHNNNLRDGRFSSPVSSMGPRKFFNSTPRQDFRPRGSANLNQDFRPRMNMTPNQEFRPRLSSTPNMDFRTMNPDQMRRMQRPPLFSRSPGAPNLRGNFQNSPRMFKGGRPFRRGW